MFNPYFGGHEDEACCYSREEVSLWACFRLLWQQHVYWTRMVIMGIVFDLPDLEQTSERLLRNPSDFARVFCRFYGREVAKKLECLLRDHLLIAAELVKAAKAGNSKMAADAEKRWYANADEIACFLNHINRCWSIKKMRAMWHDHLALTKEEAVAMLGEDYAKALRYSTK